MMENKQTEALAEIAIKEHEKRDKLRKAIREPAYLYYFGGVRKTCRALLMLFIAFLCIFKPNEPLFEIRETGIWFVLIVILFMEIKRQRDRFNALVRLFETESRENKSISQSERSGKIHDNIIQIMLIICAVLLYSCRSPNYIRPTTDISSDNLKHTVKYLSTLNPPRSYEHQVSLKKAAGYIFNKFKEYGLSPEMQEFSVGVNKYENVIASVGPKDGARVIVGAHYDVYGDNPGADDNASGVAGLLEVARFIKKHEAELKYRVDFVGYTLEEPPFFGGREMGSYIHAESLHKNNIKVRSMICLEMIGFFSNKADSQKYPLALLSWFHSSTGNYIGVISNFSSSSLANNISGHLEATSINVETVKAPASLTGVDFSDHRNYWAFGYDAVMITDTAFFRNPNYHERSDTADTLNYFKMKQVVEGVCGYLLNMQ
jgi:Peptidase family M28